MNILIPHHWLLDHLETEASHDDIQRLLSLSGPSVERVEERAGDQVYDIEVTTNRVDSMSVRGIAREAAVILQQADVPAKLKPKPAENIEIKPSIDPPLPLPKITNHPQLNQRMICVVLANIKRNPTPEWMARRLQQVEMNVHDAAIDITNYVTHELGHPCHAFDYDKVMEQGGEIIITEAAAGEKFITLDGESFITVGGEVVFKNPAGSIIDLPSIKGTANTSVNEKTTNILLLMESIDAQKVRFASMTHAIRTVAAQLMEKKVDPYLAEDVLKRTVQLYQELCAAQIGSPVYDDFPLPPQPAKITLTTHKINAYLGLDLPKDQITHILADLGCVVEWQDDQTLSVTPPTYRADLVLAVDVIEELARIYGYHNLPSKLMDTPIPTNRPTEMRFEIEHRVKEMLADLGWQELYTYSMVSADLATQSGHPLTDHLKLANPLTDDRVYLRRSLVPSLLEVMDQHPDRKQLELFELAHVYHPQAGELPKQEFHLTLVCNLPYRELRGEIEAFLRRFFVDQITIKQTSDLAADLLIGNDSGTNLVGTIKILPQSRIAVEINFSKLLPHLKTHPHYQPISKGEALKEDLTFQLPPKTALGKVMQTIITADAKVTAVELKDIYEHNFTFEITFNDPHRSLSSAEIQPLRQKIIDTVTQQFQAKLIGSL